jgi:hypothetical protein
MLGGLGFIVGLIFLLVGTPNHWFAGVHTVGVILLLVDLVPAMIVLVVLIFGGVGALTFWRRH